jgi:hypothetical protein
MSEVIEYGWKVCENVDRIPQHADRKHANQNGEELFRGEVVHEGVERWDLTRTRPALGLAIPGITQPRQSRRLLPDGPASEMSRDSGKGV